MKSARGPDGLPSYAESLVPHQHLPSSLALARSSLVNSILTTYITPHLQTSALCGLASTTMLLVPSNVAALQPSTTSSKDASQSTATFPGEKIVGFPHAENLTIIRLNEPENSVEFWQQPAVLRELENQICIKLEQEGHNIPIQSNGRTSQPQSPSASRPRQALTTGWRASSVPVLAAGEARVGVDTKEICLRVENEMGLFETKTGKALIVKVDVGN